MYVARIIEHGRTVATPNGPNPTAVVTVVEVEGSPPRLLAVNARGTQGEERDEIVRGAVRAQLGGYMVRILE